MRTLVVLAVAVLVPVLCVDITKQRCELRDQLRAVVSPRKGREHKMARVICGVEKFVKPKPAFSPSSRALTAKNQDSSNDSSKELRGHGRVDTYCVAMTKGTDEAVDSVCFGKNGVFRVVYLNPGKGCKKIDPVDFFQSCSNSKYSKRSLSTELIENSDSSTQLEQSDSEGESYSYEQSDEEAQSYSYEQSDEEAQSYSEGQFDEEGQSDEEAQSYSEGQPDEEGQYLYEQSDSEE